MEKRIILAIGLCVAVMVFWTKFFPVRPPTPPLVPAQTAPATPATAQAGASAGTSPAPAGAAITNRPEQKVELVTPDAHFVFSSRGGTLLHAELTNAKFRDHPNDPASGHDSRLDAGAPRGAAPDDLPGLGLPGARRRRLGDPPARPQHGHLRRRHGQRPHREALRRRHHPLPAPPRRLYHQPRRAAGRSPPGRRALGPPGSRETWRRVHVGIVGQHGLDALRGRRQGRAQADRQAGQGPASTSRGR